MSTAPLPELKAATIIQRIASGDVPREFLVHAANGLLPLPQEELVGVLANLGASGDEEISTLAKKSLAEIPPAVVLSVARNPETDPLIIEALALVSDEGQVIEAVIRNRATPDHTILRLASLVGGILQEVIVINQTRILRTPEILDAILANPELTQDVRRRALEVKEEFFEKKARIEEQRADEAEAAAEQANLDAIADLLEKAAAEDAAGKAQAKIDLSAEDLADPEKQSVFTQILLMSVSGRVQLAFKAGKTARSILIRDQNRLVCGAVMRNPRMTDSEVETIAGMRNINEDVLRAITLRRAWVTKYPIMMALVRNPKTPIGVVLPLINRLTLRDLKSLRSDKNVSETIRNSARKLFEIRGKKQ